MTGQTSNDHELTDHALNEELPTWGVLALESHHSPRFTMQWRTHPFVKVVYVLKGKGTFCFANSSSTFAASDVIVVPPGTKNRIEDAPGSAASLYVCCLATTLFDFDSSLIDRFRRETIQNDGHFSNRVASLMRRLVYTQNQGGPHCALSMVSDAMRLSQRIIGRSRIDTSKAAVPRWDDAVPSSDTAQDAMKYYIESLKTDFFETTTIDQAAQDLGMSRRAFTKRFSDTTGVTWLTYVRRLAIEHAMNRLRETRLPITSVAFECGFNDLSTFYRQFKRQAGKSPGAFRAQYDINKKNARTPTSE